MRWCTCAFSSSSPSRESKCLGSFLVQRFYVRTCMRLQLFRLSVRNPETGGCVFGSRKTNHCCVPITFPRTIFLLNSFSVVSSFLFSPCKSHIIHHVSCSYVSRSRRGDVPGRSVFDQHSSWHCRAGLVALTICKTVGKCFDLI